jgi:hypothetical protein
MPEFSVEKPRLKATPVQVGVWDSFLQFGSVALTCGNYLPYSRHAPYMSGTLAYACMLVKGTQQLPYMPSYFMRCCFLQVL